MSGALPGWFASGAEVRWAFVGPDGPDVLVWSVMPGAGWSATARLERRGDVLASLPVHVQAQGEDVPGCVHVGTPGGELVLVLGPGPGVWYAVTTLWKPLGVGGGRYEAPVAAGLPASVHQSS